jgi:hypothetical protein
MRPWSGCAGVDVIIYLSTWLQSLSIYTGVALCCHEYYLWSGGGFRLLLEQYWRLPHLWGWAGTFCIVMRCHCFCHALKLLLKGGTILRTSSLLRVFSKAANTVTPKYHYPACLSATRR